MMITTCCIGEPVVRDACRSGTPLERAARRSGTPLEIAEFDPLVLHAPRIAAATKATKA
jgi:hypothetical protein